MDHTFVVVSKKSSPNSRDSSFSHTLSSMSFIVLRITFRSLVHFELIFVKSISLIFFSCGCLVIPVSFVEKTIFALFYCFAPLSDISWLTLCEPTCLFFGNFKLAWLSQLYNKSWSWGVSVLQLCFSPFILCWRFWVFCLFNQLGMLIPTK